MKIIKSKKNGRWFTVKNEAERLYILDGYGMCPKDDVSETFEIDMEPMEMLFILLKKGVNITNEISGVGYEKYLDMVEQQNYGDDFILTEKEFWAIKELHTQINFGIKVDYTEYKK